MMSESPPKGARRLCAANEKETISTSPQLAASATPTRLSKVFFRVAPSRWRLSPSAFIVAAVHASPMPMSVLESSDASEANEGGGGGGGGHERNHMKGLGVKLHSDIVNGAAPAPAANACRSSA